MAPQDPTVTLATLPPELIQHVAVRLNSLNAYRNLAICNRRMYALLLATTSDPSDGGSSSSSAHLVKRHLLHQHGGSTAQPLLEVLEHVVELETSLAVWCVGKEPGVGAVVLRSRSPRRSLASGNDASRDATHNFLPSLPSSNNDKLSSIPADPYQTMIVQRTHHMLNRWLTILRAFFDTPALFAVQRLHAKSMHALFALTPTSSELVERKMDVLQRVVEQNAENIETIRVLLRAIFRTAIMLGEEPIVAYLLDNPLTGATLRHDVCEQWWVIRALTDQRMHLANLLLQRGFGVAREHNVTAVQILATNGPATTLALLLDYIRERLAKDGDVFEQEWTACMRGAWNASTYEGRTDVVRLLLTPSYAVHPRFENDAALSWSCRRGHADILRELAAAATDRIALSMDEQRFYLQLAVSNRHAEVVRVLLREFCRALAKEEGSFERSMLLREAARLGALDVVHVLMEECNDGASCEHDGTTALKVAAAHGHTHVVAYLSSFERGGGGSSAQ